MKTSASSRRIASFAAAIAALALTLTACSGTDGETASTDTGAGAEGNGELTELVVGGVTSLDLAPIVLAEEQGFFAEEGLTVTIQPVQGTSAVLLPSIISGDVPIGYSAISATLYAVAQGLPLVSIAPMAFADRAEPDASAFFVASNSDITTLKDLEGKRFGVPGLRSWAEIATREALEVNGVDSSTIEFVEVPFPDLVAALDTNRVDAGFSLEPFTTILASQGMRKLDGAFHNLTTESEPLLQNTELITSDQYLAEHPENIAAFQRGLLRGVEYANANPDAARKAIQTLLPNLPDAVVENLALPVWLPEADRSSYERIEALNRKHGGMTGEVDLDRLLANTK